VPLAVTRGRFGPVPGRRPDLAAGDQRGINWRRPALPAIVTFQVVLANAGHQIR
jgi:hypothetical protein